MSLIPYLSLVNPLLNASIPSNLVILLLNASLSSDPACYGQNPPHEGQLIPLIYSECRNVIRKIFMSEKSSLLLVFSRSDDAGFPVPDSWYEGRCAITIDVDGAEGETSTLVAVLSRVKLLMERCVIKPPHLGGRSFVGEKELLEVVVYGFEPG